MTEIYYRHKQTGILISLKQLKEQPEAIWGVNFPDNQTTYIAKDIPLSDDFENVNNEAFSTAELKFIRYAVSHVDNCEDVIEKIDKLINNKIKLEEQNG